MPNDFVMPKRGICLAFDFGESRIGVAQGEISLGVATPLTTVLGKSNQEKFNHIQHLIQEWQPEYCVVGLPCYLNGEAHELTHLARKFGQRLNGRFRLPVFFVDERLSSVYAEELLTQAHVFGKKRKAVLDQVAAQAILNSFFDGAVVDCIDGLFQAA